MAAYWQPTAEAYLSRVSKAQILEAVREAKSEAEADRIATMKKPDMAARAERLLEGTGWLPIILRREPPAADTHDEAAVA
jgi:ParB family chromosome partitioning protein